MTKSKNSNRSFSYKENTQLEERIASLAGAIVILKTLGHHLYEHGDDYSLQLVWEALQNLGPLRKKFIDEMREMKGLEPWAETLDGLWSDME